MKKLKSISDFEKKSSGKLNLGTIYGGKVMMGTYDLSDCNQTGSSTTPDCGDKTADTGC